MTTELAILQNKQSVDPRRRSHCAGAEKLRAYYRRDWENVRRRFPRGCGWPNHAPHTPVALLADADTTVRQTQLPYMWSHRAALSSSRAFTRRCADIELCEGTITERGHRNIRRSIRDREVLPLP